MVSLQLQVNPDAKSNITFNIENMEFDSNNSLLSQNYLTSNPHFSIKKGKQKLKQTKKKVERLQLMMQIILTKHSTQ